MQSIHILGECWLFWTGICFTSSCCSPDLPEDPRFHGSHGEGWLTSSVRCKGWWWSKHRCSNRFRCAIRLRNSPVWYSFALNWLNGPKWVWLTEACSHCPQGRRKREWAGSQHPVASLAVSDLTEHKSGLGTVMKWCSGAKAEKTHFPSPDFHGRPYHRWTNTSTGYPILLDMEMLLKNLTVGPACFEHWEVQDDTGCEVPPCSLTTHSVPQAKR